MYINIFRCNDKVCPKNLEKFNEQRLNTPLTKEQVGRVIFPGSMFDVELVVEFDGIEYRGFQEEFMNYESEI